MSRSDDKCVLVTETPPSSVITVIRWEGGARSDLSGSLGLVSVEMKLDGIEGGGLLIEIETGQHTAQWHPVSFIIINNTPPDLEGMHQKDFSEKGIQFSFHPVAKISCTSFFANA